MIFLLFQFETIESLAIYANIDYFFAGPLNGGFRFFVYLTFHITGWQGFGQYSVLPLFFKAAV